jgi:Sec-independent protein translocase protein TatA
VNALTVLIAFVLLILFLQSGHIEVLFVLLLILGLATPEQLAAIARQLGKMYYAAKKITEDLTKPVQGDLLSNIGKVGEWRSRRMSEIAGKELKKKAVEKAAKEVLGDDELIRKIGKLLEETKKP